MNFATSEDAEQEFYNAFSNASVDQMKTVWLDSTETICIHPMSPRITGYSSIIRSWLTIFQNQGSVPCRIENVEITQGPVLSVHTGVEVLLQDAQEIRMQVTNVYQITDTGWQMILHHGSPLQTVNPPSRLDSQVH